MVKVLPFSSWLAQETVPLCRSTMAFTIASPRPLPVAEFGVREVETV